jgi:hypothetical protein
MMAAVPDYSQGLFLVLHLYTPLSEGATSNSPITAPTAQENTAQFIHTILLLVRSS